MKLPTQDRDVFQKIPVGESAEFFTMLDDLEVHVSVRNDMEYEVELYEQFLIGACKMGVADMRKEGRNIYEDVHIYDMEEGGHKCSLLIWVENDEL